MAKKAKASSVKLTKADRNAIARVKKIKTKLMNDKKKAEGVVAGINAKMKELDK